MLRVRLRTWLRAPFRGTWRGNEFSPLAAKRLLRKSGGVIVEIGSADGLDTQRFLRLMPATARIVAIEPDPRHRESMEALSADDRLTFLGMAVSSENRTLPFFVSNTPYSSSLKPPTKALFNKWPDIAFENEIRVKAETLDSIFEMQRLEIVDLIWADVQGAELDLIAGASKALAKTRYFYSEFSPERYYQDAPTLGELRAALGPNWRQMATYQDNVLFRNTNLQT